MSEEKFRASLEDINILTTDALLGSGLLEQYEKEIEWVNNIPDSVFLNKNDCYEFMENKEIFKEEMKERIRQNFFDRLNSRLQTSAMLYTKKFVM